MRNSRPQIVECFTSIQNEEGWDQNSICESIGFQKMLEDVDFIFFLEFFHDMFAHVEILFGILQHRKSTKIVAEEVLKNFENAVIHMRANVTNYSLSSDKSNSLPETFAPQPAKKFKRGTLQPSASCATEVCDKIIHELNTKFQSSDMFGSFAIVNPREFTAYKNSFPMNHLEEIATNYTMLDKEKLKVELSVLYANDTFGKMSNTCELLKFINEKELNETFSEVTKLLEIVLVTPISSADSERSFSTLKRIKTFLRNTMSQDRLNSLACLSIHKEYINSIKDFNNKVIDTFARMKERRADYLYK